MRRRIALFIAALAVLAILGAAIFNSPRWLPALERALIPAEQSSLVQTKAIPFPTPPPHVVVMHSEELGDTRILYRDGWKRSEQATDHWSSIQMTSAQGFNYGVTLSAQGEPVNLGLYRLAATVPVGRKTGATDVMLGEHCEIWASASSAESRIPLSSSMLTCITADGIVLWHGSTAPGTGARRTFDRAVALERRTPSWSEFAIPREALNYEYWSSRFILPPETARPAYEIRYGQRIVRVRGNAWFDGGSNGGGIAHTPDMAIHYQPLQGNRSSIEIRTSPQPSLPNAMSGGSQPMDRAPLHILGERCNWRRVYMEVRYAIVGVCVTHDGIQLAQSTDYHDELHQDELDVATYFNRGAPNAALMLPPANVFAPWIAALPPQGGR